MTFIRITIENCLDNEDLNFLLEPEAIIHMNLARKKSVELRIDPAQESEILLRFIPDWSKHKMIQVIPEKVEPTVYYENVNVYDLLEKGELPNPPA